VEEVNRKKGQRGKRGGEWWDEESEDDFEQAGDQRESDRDDEKDAAEDGVGVQAVKILKNHGEGDEPRDAGGDEGVAEGVLFAVDPILEAGGDRARGEGDIGVDAGDGFSEGSGEKHEAEDGAEREIEAEIVEVERVKRENDEGGEREELE
jgi:hypothetical protein